MYLRNPTGLLTNSKSQVSLEFWLSIVVACLPALAPFFKHHKIFSTLIPSTIRSKFGHPSTTPKASWPQKLGGPSQDIELGAPGDQQRPHASWQVPRAWKEAEKRGSDEYDRISSVNSEQSLRPVLPTHREIKHGD